MRAATGGVVGINGVGIFLGENDVSTEAIVRAIDYVVDAIGPEHVGLGLDYVFDQDELHAYVAEHRNTFPTGERGTATTAPLREPGAAPRDHGLASSTRGTTPSRSGRSSEVTFSA